MIQIQTVPETTLPDLVGVPQAAEYLGVGRKIIYQLLEFGELKAIRRQGKIWIDPCSLREFRQHKRMV
jgi:excisionase family DNA binding protein